MTKLAGDGFEIVFVCHANLCRSPLAERLARQEIEDAFGPSSGVTTASAGTHAYAGEPMHRGSAQVLSECGVDAGGFASRPLSPSILGGADLVLAAAREQRAACVTMVPASVRRTFTLRQFIRYVAAVPPSEALTSGPAPDRLRALVEQIGAVRHLVQPVPGHEDDLPDPVRQPIEAFRACADEIRHAMSVMVGVIAPA
ncbi:MAG TPA: low molecular weight phosphatase family protein [Actinoplanes sp.]